MRGWLGWSAVVAIGCAPGATSGSQDGLGSPPDTGSATPTVTVPSPAPTTSTTTRTPRCAKPYAVGSHDASIQVGGDDRRYLLEVPPAYDGRTSLPVVIDLHGTFANPEEQQLLSGLDDAAREDGFIGVWPESRELGGIKAFALTCSGPDVDFVTAVLDAVEADLCVDPARVYVTGVSNGAFFTEILAGVLEGRITAIAPVAGGLGVMPTLCPPADALPTLHVHGTADEVVPIDEGIAARDWWLAHDACGPLASDAQGCSSAACADGTAVQWCQADDVGHVLIYAEYPTTDAIRAFFGTASR